MLSEKVPVALNSWEVPGASLGFAGVTARETSVLGAATVLPPPPPHPEIARSGSKRMKSLSNRISSYPRR